jgi:4-amino-4-deoxy-L-arabinose transferase-like glycosyltransferase
MKTDPLRVLAKFLRHAVAVGAAMYLLLYLVLAILRIPYPFELEWMEGGAVDHVRRILAGQPLYVQPSLEFVPYIYTPLYFYLSAALAKVIGVGFLPLRLLSLLASLGCFGTIYLLVRRESSSPWAGLLAAGLFAATYRAGGAWLDIARVDSLFLLLLLLTIYTLRFSASWRSAVLAGLLLFLSFFTKQTALLVALPLLLYSILAHRRRALPFIATFLVLAAGSTVALDALHQGWYVYYLFVLPQQHPWLPEALFTFWAQDLLLTLPLAGLVSLFYLWQRLRQRPDPQRTFYFLVAVGLVAASWFSRLHVGGYDNVLLPAYAASAILAGLGVHRLRSDLGASRTLLQIGFHLACLAQMALLIYNPAAQVPTPQDRAAGESFLQAVEEIPGEVWVPFHGYLPTLAGKESHAQWYAVADVLRGAAGPIRTQLSEEIQQALRDRRFAAIFVDIADWFPEQLGKYYEQGPAVFANEAVFWPVTGPRIRPEYLYLPKLEPGAP